MGMSNILIEKPPRIHNLSYFVLGYYISTLLSFEANYSISDRIIVITFIGGFLGTLIYYIKPVEKCINLYFRISGNNAIRPPEEIREFSVPIYKTDLLYSKYLSEDRVIINGAIFLGIGLLLSNNFLHEYQLSFLSQYVIVTSILLIIVGLWEIYILIHSHMGPIIFYYTFYNDSDKIKDLSVALETRDWIQAKKTIEDDLLMWDPNLYMDVYGKVVTSSICPKCNKNVDQKAGEYCTECGTLLILNCPSCDALIYQKNNPPKFCKFCGVDIYECPNEVK